MASGGGGKEDGITGQSQEREEPPGHVLALPAAVLPPVVCHEEAAVPRKVRSCVPRAAPSAWWSYRIPALPPPPAKNPAAEEVRAPRPQGIRVAPFPDAGTASPVETPPKRARRCLHCDAAETPQWRQGPLGRTTLCNACGIVYRATGALPEHRTSAHQVAEAPREVPIAGSPPESPIWEPEVSPPESPIWEPEVSPAIYLVRKPAKLRRPPRNEATPAPPPSPPVPRAKKGRNWLCWGSSKTTQWREFPRPPREEAAPAPRRTKGRSCLHCSSSRTPQWREGPMGRGTLCNACGVRYRQGRLLPEYRPIASPTFVPSEHANTHRQVLKLHQLRQSKDPPVADEHPIDAPSCTDAPGWADEPSSLCSLDSLLFDGPSAPPIVDGDDFFS